MNFIAFKRLVLSLLMLMFSQVNAQSIRKDYREMTDYEKTELVNAFYTIRSTTPVRITDMANFHMDFINYDNIDPDVLDNHFNFTAEPEKEFFLARHRRFILELEQVMQAINPSIS